MIEPVQPKPLERRDPFNVAPHWPHPGKSEFAARFGTALNQPVKATLAERLRNAAKGLLS